MFEICTQALTPEDYAELYTSVGWNAPQDRRRIRLALDNSAFTVCIKDDGKPVGMGRLIGDGAISYFIKDVAVKPEFQHQGIGRMIVESLIDYVKSSTPKGWDISLELIASENKESFYELFGFGKKPGDGMGHGMIGLVMGENPWNQKAADTARM